VYTDEAAFEAHLRDTVPIAKEFVEKNDILDGEMQVVMHEFVDE
jgi:hypothetical protein